MQLLRQGGRDLLSRRDAAAYALSHHDRSGHSDDQGDLVTPKRTPRGHPAKQDADVAQLFKTMRSTVELVRALDGRLTDEGHLNLRAAALGLLWVYSEMAGLPAPDEIIGGKQ